MTYYTRIGNRSITDAELGMLKPADIKKIEEDFEISEQKRKDNLAKALGIDKSKVTQNVTFDVRPEAIAARAAEKAKQDAEAQAAIVVSEAEEAAVPADKTAKEEKGSGKKSKVAKN